MAKTPGRFPVRLPRVLRKELYLIAMPLLTAAATVQLLAFLYPVEVRQVADRWELWRRGVREVELAGLHGYAADTCQRAHAPQTRLNTPGELPGPDCPCVVLLHGLGDNALTWRKILLTARKDPSFPASKLIALDLPGAGQTPAPPRSEGYEVRAQAKAVENALAPVCSKWTIVGNSLGGWVGTWVALGSPALVERLILVSPMGLGERPEAHAALASLTAPTVAGLQEFQRRAYAHPRPRSGYQWRGAVAHLLGAHVREIAAAQTAESRLTSRISAFDAEAWLLWGAEDRILPPTTEGATWRLALPRALWTEVPACGHLPQKECPTALVNLLRLAFANPKDFGH